MYFHSILIQTKSRLKSVDRNRNTPYSGAAATPRSNTPPQGTHFWIFKPFSATGPIETDSLCYFGAAVMVMVMNMDPFSRKAAGDD